MLTLKICKLCDSSNLWVVKKYTATSDLNANWQHAFESALQGKRKIEIRLALCLNCGFLFYLDVLDTQELEKLYANENRCEREVLSSTKPGRQWELREMEAFARKNFTGKVIKNALDIGAGDFVALRRIAALLPGTSITAVDPCFSEPTFGNIRVLQGMLDDIESSETYDLVMAVHVLEHVGDLHAFLEKMHSLAAKYIYIEIPFQVGPGLFFNRSGNAQHINYFTPQTIRRLVASHGFLVEDFSFSTDGFRYNGMPGMIRLFAERSENSKVQESSSVLASLYHLFNPGIFIKSKFNF